MKRKKLFIMPVFLLFLAGCYGRVQEAGDMAETRFFGMDTDISIKAYGKNAEAALEDAESKIAELEKLWSVTDENSDIYKINCSRGEPVSISSETKEILSFALGMAEKTGGVLEPTIYPVITAWGFTTEQNRIPSSSELQEILENVDYRRVVLSGDEVALPDGMELDLGAVGKGYAADVVTDILKDRGVSSALLNLGGNIQAVGAKPDGSDWRVGLQNPFGDSYVGVLSVSDSAVVTSGSYERYFIGDDGRRYGHILNPFTGYPAETGLASVTIVAEAGKLSDALSTSLFVMGLEGAVDYWKENQDFEMILFTEDGKICLTEGLEDKFELEPDYSNAEIELI
ncbi:MAG: FAD:protein FMN transferase, partial [Lachnospiraceae bacterium]|nr:FAD:protein FMN transferase [Lachnospiraceae bacterium]